MQEIIVYRNPAEAALWQLLMSGEFFVVLCGILAFFAVFLGMHAVMTRIWGSWGNGAKLRSYLGLAAGAAAGVATVWAMWL